MLILRFPSLTSTRFSTRRNWRGASRVVIPACSIISMNGSALPSTRHLQRIDVDDAVVNMTSRKRGEQVLYRRDHDTLPHQRGRVTDVRYVLRRCRDLKVVQ